MREWYYMDEEARIELRDCSKCRGAQLFLPTAGNNAPRWSLRRIGSGRWNKGRMAFMIMANVCIQLFVSLNKISAAHLYILSDRIYFLRNVMHLHPEGVLRRPGTFAERKSSDPVFMRSRYLLLISQILHYFSQRVQ